MSSTVPYIGSKISLVSNSDIRYEGILYTINTQESTIALQSVRCCGTEGRKVPEIPPSSEIYDFIIFRGQDIKDLTVLESANPALSAQLNDPAIMSVNQRPAGAAASKTSSAAAGGKGSTTSASAGYGGGKGSSSGGGYGKGKDSTRESSRGGDWSGGGWGGSGWGKGDSRSNDRSYGKGYGGWESGSGYGKGSGGKGKVAESSKGGGKDKGKGKDSKGGGKADGKAGKATGKGKDSKGDKGGKSSSKGGKATEGKSSSKGGKASEGGSRRGGGGGGGDSSGGAPVGELLPSANEAEKSKYAEDFDYAAENQKFEGSKKGMDGEEVDDKLKPLSGYDKGKSFFDNISCEATERAGDAERPKVDRNKARQNDRETFGDTRRPPRPTGGRRGKGGRRGGQKGYRN